MAKWYIGGIEPPKDGQMDWNGQPFKPGQPYFPLIKHKGFDPSPVAGKIPYFANSLLNPDCVGSTLWEEWWDEQHDRNINGYFTAHQWIPGRYYYYLNFNPVTGLKGRDFPYYIDFDLEWYYTVEQIKKYRAKGLIEPKARRKGISEKACSLVNHGLRYIEGYKAGIAAGIEDYLTGFRTKLEPNITTTKIPEMYLGTLRNTDTELSIGYEVKVEDGSFTKDGNGAQLRFATMYNNYKKLEGEYFHDVIMEESGHFPYVDEAINSIDPAMMFGAVRGGTFYVYGTGGNIRAGSKGFKRLWYHGEQEGFVRLFVPGNRLYFPFIGGIGENEVVVNPITNLKVDPIKNLRHMEPYQRIGCEDTKTADEFIDNMSEHLRLNSAKNKYLDFKKANPKNAEEAFESGGSNNFNNDKLYEQKYKVGSEQKLYTDWIVELVKEKNQIGQLVPKIPLEATARPAIDSDSEWKKVKILNNGHPIKGYKNLDVGGTDSYNQDQTNTSDSLGGICILRQGDKIPAHVGVLHGKRYPVCIYKGRPPRKEQFFEISLALSVYYDLFRNMMLSAEYDLIINFFKQNGGKRYLAPRPRSFDSPNSEAEYKWGVKMNSYNKPLMVGLMQTDVEDNCDANNFEDLIDELIAYDEFNIGSDWDLADAYGYALMRCSDMKTSVSDTGMYNANERDTSAFYINDRGDYQLKEGYWSNTATIYDVMNRHMLGDEDDKPIRFYPTDFTDFSKID